MAAKPNIHNLLDEMEGFHAWDAGAVDSGVKNDARKADVARQFDALSELEIRLGVSKWLAKVYLSDEALSKGYGWEDALEFCRWLDEGEYRP